VKDEVGRDELVRQLDELGVESGSVLVVHTSFSTVAPVVGGPAGLIGALGEALGPDGTLVMPSMSDWDDDEVFDPRETPCEDLGIVADTFWRMPDVLRSDSPHSFSAAGPHAETITAAHPPDLPHGPNSPVGRAHDLDGWVLLLGVDHDANTTVHLAEFCAGVPYRAPKFCTVVRDGVPTRVDYGEIDHCCRNFKLVGEWLAERSLERRGPVGHATARLVRSRDVVSTVGEELAGDVYRLLCAEGTGCDDCDVARRGAVGEAQADDD
jgi:aminoglycoside N3'-acetyltransferase